MRVAVLYNDDGSHAHGEAHDAVAVQGVIACARGVADTLRTLGHDAFLCAVGPDPRAAIGVVDALSCDAVFNFVESIAGDAALEPAFISLLELRGIPFTGASSRAVSLCLEKPLTQALLAASGIRVPPHVLLTTGDEPLGDLPLPAIVKPSREDASHGIAVASVVAGEEALRARARYVIGQYRQPALVEAFIDGREINVGLLQTPRGLEALPLSEIAFAETLDARARIVTYDAKWIDSSADWANTRVVPARMSADQAARVEAISRAAFERLGLSGYGRVDMRLDASGEPFVIDVNPNPDLSSDAGFALAAARSGRSYADVVASILDAALRRRTIPEAV